MSCKTLGTAVMTSGACSSSRLAVAEAASNRSRRSVEATAAGTTSSRVCSCSAPIDGADRGVSDQLSGCCVDMERSLARSEWAWARPLPRELPALPLSRETVRLAAAIAVDLHSVGIYIPRNSSVVVSAPRECAPEGQRPEAGISRLSLEFPRAVSDAHGRLPSAPIEGHA